MPDGSFLIADRGNHAIREVSNGFITTIAGTGVAGSSGDGGPATAAQLNTPFGVTVTPAGDILIADTPEAMADAVVTMRSDSPQTQELIANARRLVQTKYDWNVVGEILLRLSGWPKVERVLQAIDAVEQLGIDPADACPDHWRHVQNRLASGDAPRPYTRERHCAWLLRRRIEA